MKYPITPEYFKSAPKEVVELYERLEAFIISDICKRFAASETATNTAIEQIRILKRYGYDMSAIERKIRQTTGMSIDEYNAMWEDAVERNEEYYGGLVTKAGLTAADVSREALKDEVEALRKQTLGEFINITQSMGFAFRNADGKVNVTPIGRVYQRILDDAEMQILSGGASYNQAMKDAVVKLADSGLQYVDYESGWHNRIDVAARRACMTGITQVSAKYSEQYMSDLDAGYVEVTAHVGARDVDGPLGWENHKKWQGRVYRLKDAPVTDEAEFKSAPEFESTTGYGDGAGLCGWNCRHSFYPFIPGISESTYTDEDLKNIDPPPFEYDGKTYTAYEATQMQRKIETAMRASKRKMAAYEAAGLQDDYEAESVKYTIIRQKYTSFSQTAGLTEQMERVNIADVKRPTEKLSQTMDFVSIPEEYVDNYDDFEMIELDSKQEKILTNLHEAAAANGFEYGAIYADEKYGEIFTSNENNAVAIPVEVWENKTVDLYHSHTNTSMFSTADFKLLASHENLRSIFVVSGDGSVFEASVGYGIMPTVDEFEYAVKQIELDLTNDLTELPGYDDWTIEERNYVYIREKAYRIARMFEWTLKGGRI